MHGSLRSRKDSRSVSRQSELKQKEAGMLAAQRTSPDPVKIPIAVKTREDNLAVTIL